MFSLQWLDLLKSMLQEAEWQINKSVPTLDEYMINGYVSFALGPIVLPAVYFVGPSVSEKVVKSDEFNNLYKLMSTCGRLHNDIHSFKVHLFFPLKKTLKQLYLHPCSYTTRSWNAIGLNFFFFFLIINN